MVKPEPLLFRHDCLPDMIKLFDSELALFDENWKGLFCAPLNNGVVKVDRSEKRMGGTPYIIMLPNG